MSSENNQKRSFANYVFSVFNQYKWLLLFFLAIKISLAFIDKYFSISTGVVTANLMGLFGEPKVESAIIKSSFFRLLFLYIVYSVVDFWGWCVYNNLSVKLRRDVCFNLFQQIQILPFYYFQKHPPSNFLTQISLLEENIDKIVFLTIENISILFLALLVILEVFHLNKFLGLIILIWLSCHLLKRLISYKRIQKANQRVNESIANTTGFINDSFHHQFVKNLFQNYKNEANKMEYLLKDRKRKDFYSKSLINKTQFFLEILLFIFIPVIALRFVLLSSVLSNHIKEAAVAMSLWNLVWLLVRSVWWRLNERDFFQALGSASSIFYFFEDLSCKKQEIKNPLNFENGDIIFDKVGLVLAKTVVLKDITFHIKKGEIVHLRGVTGSGKTTLLSLLSKIFDHWSGDITINGIDLRNIPLENYVNYYTYITQTDMLFSRSIKENIEINGHVCDEVLRKVFSISGVNFIDKLGAGINTNINVLSSGQKQRICIARALCKLIKKQENSLVINPEIIIFMDEPLSNLDSKTADAFLNAFFKLIKETGNTVIIIDHTGKCSPHITKVIDIEDGSLKFGAFLTESPETH